MTSTPKKKQATAPKQRSLFEMDVKAPESPKKESSIPHLVRDAEGKITESQYNKLKEWAIGYEKNNVSTIMAFRTKDPQWYKLCGHSALFYYHRIAPRTGAHPKLATDTDFKFKSLTGIVTIRDVDLLRARLAKIKIYPLKQTKNVVVFDLGYKMRPAEIQQMENDEEEKRRMINSIVMPEQMYPDIYKRLVMIGQEMRQMVRLFQTHDREMFGVRAMVEIEDILTLYMRITNGEEPVIEGLDLLAKKMQTALYHLKVMIEMPLVDRKKGLRMSEQMIEVRKIAQAERRKLLDAAKG